MTWTKDEFIEKYGLAKYNEFREKARLRNLQNYYKKLGISREERKEYWKNKKDKLEKEKLIKQKERKIESIDRKIKRVKRHNELYSYKSHSRQIFRRMFPKLDLSEYNVHHCFGPSSDNFVVLLKKDHLNLHKKFGRNNSDCLYNNPEVKNFILCVPHLIVLNKEITENTLDI